jgi:uncharacterized secreted repeat protein (TIGR03808 family)
MTISRRHLLRTALFGTVAASAGPALAQGAPRAPAPAPLGSLGLEASHYGLKPGSIEDQSGLLQNALMEAARRDAPLLVAPGRYRIANVVLPENARLIGVPGATQFVAAQAGPLLVARRIKRAALSGLALDGLDIRLGQRSGLAAIEEVLDLALVDCAREVCTLSEPSSCLSSTKPRSAFSSSSAHSITRTVSRSRSNSASSSLLISRMRARRRSSGVRVVSDSGATA